MQTKLTLRIDDKLIHRAKAFAARTGRSVSQVVADCFAVLDEQKDADGARLPPITRSLKTVLQGTNVDEEDYPRYLEEKYL